MCPHLEFFWSECGKIHARKTPNTDTFHAVAALLCMAFQWTPGVNGLIYFRGSIISQQTIH